MRTEHEIRAGILEYVSKALLADSKDKEDAYLSIAKTLTWVLGKDENKIEHLYVTGLDVLYGDDSVV